MGRFQRSSLVRRVRRLAVVLAVASGGLVFAGHALAGTASISGSTLRFDAANGEANQVEIYLSSSTYYVFDFNATTATNPNPITAGAGCTFVSNTEVTCPSAGIGTILTQLGDQNDAAYIYPGTGVVSKLYGGTGDDFWLWTAGYGSYAYTWGGSGNDTIAAGWSNASWDGGGPDADGGSNTATPGSNFVSWAWDGMGVTVDDNVNDAYGLHGMATIGTASQFIFNADNLEGTWYDDTMTGNDSAETFYMHGGNDTVNGLGGNDTIFGDQGNDTLNGGGGNDIIYGGTTGYYNNNPSADGNDTIDGGLGDDTIYGGAGDNTIHGGPGNDTLNGAFYFYINAAADGSNAIYGDDGNDYMIGGASSDVLDGGPGNDTEIGATGNDTYDGGDGSDTLYEYQCTLTCGDSGNDTMRGGSGLDYVYGGSGNDTMEGGDTNDYLYGDTGDDYIHGNDGNDYIDGADGNDTDEGDAGNDYLAGGNGNDSLNGGAGTDILRGGAGSDIAWSDYQTLNETVTLDDIANDGVAGENDNVRSDVESVFTGSGNDTIVGNAANNYLEGGEGNDTIKGMGGNDTLVGDADSDNLDGGDGNDALYGLYGYWPADPTIDGSDILSGSNGDDLLVGGPGADTLNGGVGSDTVSYFDHPAGVTASINGLANSGLPGENDKIAVDVENLTGSVYNDVLNGSLMPNVITGGSGDDQINGGAANDVLLGGPGNDTISGGLGDDRVQGNAGNDSLFGNTSIAIGTAGDTLDFSGAASGITVNLGVSTPQVVSAAEGTDTMYGFFSVLGSPYNDLITASATGAGTLRALDGNDTIYARNGFKDTVDGGNGTDSAQVDSGTVTDVVSNVETLLP